MNAPSQFPQGSPEHFLSQVQPYELKANDVNLIAAARDILLAELTKYGLQERICFFDNDANIVPSQTLTTEIQRYKLNQFLNSQYCMLSGNISTHRGYILTFGDVDSWLQMFRSYHAPVMVQNGLPSGYIHAS